jgi:hypothetical protein
MFWRIHRRGVSTGGLSQVTDDSTKHNLQRTNMFLTCALLSLKDEQGILYVYEHGVESFFKVGMWVVFCSGNDPLARDFPLVRWDTMDCGG